MTALHKIDLSTAEFEGGLPLYPGVTPAEEGYEFVVMGDLRPAFGVGDDFEADEEGRHGNHIAQHLIEESMRANAPELCGDVIFESESATFFMYATTREAALVAMGYVEAFAKEKGLVVA